MDIKLPKAVLDGLPGPDDSGLVRVNIALKVGSDGKASIVEVNDTPVPAGDEEATEGETAEAGKTGAQEALDMPSPEQVGESMY